jgi:hypothetical protein
VIGAALFSRRATQRKIDIVDRTHAVMMATLATVEAGRSGIVQRRNQKLGAGDPSDQTGTRTITTVVCARTLATTGLPSRLAPQFSAASPLGK